MIERLFRGLVVGVFVFIISLFLYHFHLFDSLEWKSWDWRLNQFSHPSQASDDVVLLLIDQESLDIYEKEQGLPWPWPRQMYSAIIRYCQQAKVKALVFDFVFSEISSWGTEDDEDFSSAMAEAGNVFLPIFLSQSIKEIEEIPFNHLEKYSLADRKLPSQAIHTMKSASLPVEDLLISAHGLGNVEFSQDKDGIFRRIPLLFSYKNLVLPALPLAVVDYVKDELNLDSIPLDDSGQMIIRFYGPTGTYKSYSAAAIINSFALIEEGKVPQVSPEEFAGKIVLVGGSAPGLLDLRPTPFSAVSPGVEIQAAVIDNLLRGDFVKLPPNLVFVLFLGFLALLTAVFTSLMERMWKIVLLFLLCMSLPVTAVGVAFYYFGNWLEFVAPQFAVILAFLIATVLNYSFEGRRRRFIKSVFRHYLSSHVIERVIKNPSLLRLGGEKREISSFFSDVAGFTSISEKLSPENLVNLLNTYLSEMTDIILSHGGTLDKYEGDAIIAFWNAPLDQSDHALKACQAALLCQKRLGDLSPNLIKRYGRKLSMRIGINSGEAVVGNMGSHSRFDYTAMGDTVNLASRLEGACKQYNVPILVGETTFLEIKDVFVSREVDLIRVVGREKPVRVYEVIGDKDAVSITELKRIEVFHNALRAYRHQQWEKALGLFESLEGDDLAKLYVERTQQLNSIRLPEYWSGVYDLKEK